MPTTSDGRIIRSHGDMTGRAYDAAQRMKGNRTAAITHTINAMTTDGYALTFIPEAGGADWAIPSHVIELIRPLILRGDL